MASSPKAIPASLKARATRPRRRVQELLDGSTEALTQKAVNLALDGDTTALRLCLERICPARKDSPVQFKLPVLESAADAQGAAGAVVAAVAQGELTPIEAASVMTLIDSYRRTLETTELEKRITKLELLK